MLGPKTWYAKNPFNYEYAKLYAQIVTVIIQDKKKVIVIDEQPIELIGINLNEILSKRYLR